MRSAPIISAFRSTTSRRRRRRSRRRAAPSSSTSATSGTETSSASSRTPTASCSTSRSTAGWALTATSDKPRPPSRLLDELVGEQLLDRGLLRDDAFGEIEILELAEPLHVDLAELALPDIDQLGVV